MASAAMRAPPVVRDERVFQDWALASGHSTVLQHLFHAEEMCERKSGERAEEQTPQTGMARRQPDNIWPEPYWDVLLCNAARSSCLASSSPQHIWQNRLITLRQATYTYSCTWKFMVKPKISLSPHFKAHSTSVTESVVLVEFIRMCPFALIPKPAFNTWLKGPLHSCDIIS